MLVFPTPTPLRRRISTRGPRQHQRIQLRKQTVTSQHSASDGFSPLFSNATADQASPTHSATDAASTRKRSEPNGDHHLTFIDPLDSAPSDH